jgi:ATP-dependent Clp protease, protease subunit
MPLSQQLNTKFWNFVKNPDGTAELMLYGPISQSQSWFEDAITPQQFAKDLADLGSVNQITVKVNSGGGDPFAASAILTQLKAHSAEITVQIDGLAASAAALFLAAGKVIIPDYAQVMIHNPKMVPSSALGADDMTRLISALGSIKDGFINAMVAKTGLDKKDLSKLMDDETWMTGAVAVEKGFADELMFVEPGEDSTMMSLSDGVLFVNSVAHDLTQFKTRPKVPIKQGTIIPNMNRSGITDAVTAERARLQKFDALNGKVDPEFLAAEKYKDGVTAESVLFAAMQQGKMINSSYVSMALLDAATANAVPGVASDTAPGTQAQAAAAEVPAVLSFVQNIAKRAFNMKKQ